jgi:hypothetical protein
MLNVKAKVIPVIKGATGTISKLFINTEATYRVGKTPRNYTTTGHSTRTFESTT